MEEKYIWMILFVSILVLCSVMTFLVKFITDEKKRWMSLFVAVLALCGFLTFLLILSSGASDDSKRYKALKKEYAELAEKHAKMLKTAIEVKTENQSAPDDEMVKGGKPPTEAQLIEKNAALSKRLEKWESGFISLTNGYDDDEKLRIEIVRLTTRAKELKSDQ